MSYYDDTVASYDQQISSNNQTITTCSARIKQLEDDIEDLKNIRTKVVNVGDAVDAAVSATSAKIQGLPSAVMRAGSILKMDYFSNFLNVLKGDDQTKAKQSVDNSKTKIDSKIGELQREIEDLRGQISQCSANTASLTSQKNSYITDMEKKAAEEAAAAEAAQ